MFHAEDMKRARIKSICTQAHLHIHLQSLLWFMHSVIISFQFTFASNAATVVGGVLVTNKYKLRLPAAFLSAFVISVRLWPFFCILPFCQSILYSLNATGHNSSSHCSLDMVWSLSFCLSISILYKKWMLSWLQLKYQSLPEVVRFGLRRWWSCAYVRYIVILNKTPIKELLFSSNTYVFSSNMHSHCKSIRCNNKNCYMSFIQYLHQFIISVLTAKYLSVCIYLCTAKRCIVIPKSQVSQGKTILFMTVAIDHCLNA